MDRMSLGMLQDFLTSHGYGTIKVKKKEGQRFAVALNSKTHDVVLVEVDKRDTIAGKNFLAISARMRLMKHR